MRSAVVDFALALPVRIAVEDFEGDSGPATETCAGCGEVAAQEVTDVVLGILVSESPQICVVRKDGLYSALNSPGDVDRVSRVGRVGHRLPADPLPGFEPWEREEVAVGRV